MNKEIEISPRQIAKAINDLLDEKENLQQENKELHKRIEFLEWDNNDKKGIELSYLDLLEENNQLKEQKQELRSWLEEEMSWHSPQYNRAIENVLSKLNKLEGNK